MNHFSLFAKDEAINNWFKVSVRPLSYGWTREAAKHERRTRVPRGDSRGDSGVSGA